MAIVSTGILNPKIKNRFQVKISTKDEDSLECLTHQIVSVKNIVADRNAFFGLESGSFQIAIEDDVTCLASKAIHKLRTLDFSVQIDMLDGDERVIETTKFGGCRVQTVWYSDLDYAAPENEKFVNVQIPNKVGNAIEYLKENHPEAAAIFLALAGTNISMVKPGASTIVQHTLNISFDKLTKTFY